MIEVKGSLGAYREKRGNVKDTESPTPLCSDLLRPFLRWAGGKQKLVRSLLAFAPSSDGFKTYYEPFFGAGAMFFALQPANAVLSDINSELMNCYEQVARYPHAVGHLLRLYAKSDSPDFFYGVRALAVEDLSLRQRAARFIYLNKAAFNGIYRVSKAGKFNVPYGPSFKGPAIPSTEALTLAAKCLRKAKILSGDFEQIMSLAEDGDFVYLDPPYPPRSETAYFTHYSVNRFGWDEQIRLARVFCELSERGCYVMLSNADQIKVTSLYREFYISRLSVVRWLGSNGDRFRVREIVVTNYKTSEVGRG